MSTMLLQGILLLVASALVYFLGRQIGRERGLVHGALLCQTIAIAQQSKQHQLLLHRQQKEAQSGASSLKCAEKKKKRPVVHSTHLCPRGNPELPHPMHLLKGKATVPEDVFSGLHHPASPAKFNFFFSMDKWHPPNHVLKSPCKEIYLTRTGSRGNQPNKCISIAVVPHGYEPMNQQSYRIGYTALNTNQYQQDYPREYSKHPTASDTLLSPLLEELSDLLKVFKQKMGEPIDPITGKRRHALVMVANDGVMDLLLNFLCSAEMIDMDLKSIVVFVGDERYVTLIEHFGANAMYSPSLGSMPRQAAGFYMDNTFSRMMWYKTTSVYLALLAGFNVLFQDVDLVWLRNPYPYFMSLDQDLVFMDDGARTPRYTPFFVNSGFYFVTHNERTMYMFETFLKHAPEEIGLTHSHQSVLIRHIAESQHLFGLRVFVLDQQLFPSGQAYHENKPLIRRIQSKEYRPYVFHMCWTDNRENKVVYFKDVGLWYLPSSESEVEKTCSSASHMLAYVTARKDAHGKRDGGSSDSSKSLLDLCCKRELYWSKEEDGEELLKQQQQGTKRDTDSSISNTDNNNNKGKKKKEAVVVEEEEVVNKEHEGEIN